MNELFFACRPNGSWFCCGFKVAWLVACRDGGQVVKFSDSGEKVGVYFAG